MHLQKHRKRLLVQSLALALALPVVAVASAQDSNEEPKQGEEETSQLDRVEVVGSRIKKAQVEGPAPITVITAEDIEREGHTTVYEALNTLTQFTGSVQNELTQSGFTPNAAVINLRGLGPSRVLTLINGHRVADYPRPYNSQSNVVNLNSIPAAAISRIEVLASGASAIYGSDAVSGVVNVVLKSDFEGDALKLRGGTTTRGGGDTWDFSWGGGRTGSNWNLVYAFEALKRDPLFASERDFMDSYRDDPSVDPADATAVIGIRLRDRFVGTGTSSQVWPTGETVQSVCARFSEFEMDPRGWCGYYGYPATQAIRNEREDLSGYIRGSFDFENGMQLTSSLTVWNSDAAAASNTQFWQSPLFYDPNFDTIFDTQRIITPPEAGGVDAQQTKYNEQSLNFDIGLNGTMFNDRFDWDLFYSHSKNTSDTKRPRFVASAVNQYFLGTQQGVDPYFNFYPTYELNVDRYFSPMTPEQYNSLITTVMTETESRADSLNFVFSGDLMDLPAGPLGFAAVLEAARQEYELRPDPRTLPGADPATAIYNLTDTIGGGERNRYAAGFELSVPIVDSFKANLAGRYDKYDDMSDTGGAFTYNIGLEYRPIDSLLLRGSYGTTFRAPDMHYLYAGTSGFFTTYFDEFACRRDGNAVADCGNNPTYNYSAAGTRSGNLALEEETGKSFTVGFVWDIIDQLSLSVDYYNVELENIIGDDISRLLADEANCRLGVDRNGNAVDTGSALCADALARVIRSGGGIGGGTISRVVTSPRNLALLATNGIDANIRYSLDTDRAGQWQFEMGWSHVLEQEFQAFADDPIDSYRDDLQNFDFRSRMNASISWQKDDWTVNVYGTRWGSLPNWEETGRIAPYHLYNVNTSYQVNEDFRVGLYVNNVLDKLAPRDDSFFTYPFFWRAYSPIGREVFLQFDYKFD